MPTCRWWCGNRIDISDGLSLLTGVNTCIKNAFLSLQTPPQQGVNSARGGANGHRKQDFTLHPEIRGRNLAASLKSRLNDPACLSRIRAQAGVAPFYHMNVSAILRGDYAVTLISMSLGLLSFPFIFFFLLSGVFGSVAFLRFCRTGGRA